MNYGRYCRNKSVCHRHDLVSRSDAGCNQRKMQGVVPAVNAYGVFDTNEFRQSLLEVPQLLTINQVTFRHAIDDGGIDFGFQSAVMCFWINERDAVAHLFSFRSITRSVAATISPAPT